MARRARSEVPKDLRSTGRKRARKVLLASDRPFCCEECGWEPDPTKPLDRSNNLDANHKNKVLTDCDPANLEWLCRSCHKKKDSRTEKGVMHEEEQDKLYGEGFFF